MPELSRTAAIARALAAVEERIPAPGDGGPIASGADRDALLAAGRITVAFHPDRLDRRGRTTPDGLAVDGGYLSQWRTGASSGSRSALPGGLRARWEAALFGADGDVAPEHRPVYGALDLLQHRHGGSPAFGSCFLVLRDDVRERCTLSIGDSHLDPGDVGTFRRPEAILRGLVRQAVIGQLLGQELGLDDLRAVLDGGHRAAPRRTLDHYVEVQVHGGVRLHDIEAIVADPSFAGSEVADDLRGAAAAAGVELSWHAGTSITPDELRTHPTAVAWVGDDDYLAELVDELARLTAPSRHATAASIGRLVAGARPGPPVADGDPERGELQRVKHLWRLTYLLGRDVRTA